MSPFSIGHSALPLVTTAIHAGHDLRPEVAARMALDDATRRREEDPFTDRVTAAGGVPVVVSRSRFEVDLNRPRAAAIYRDPDDAWGLDVWREPLPDAVVERSLELYDAFYAALAGVLDDLARRGPFLVLDVHSYNHRRRGAREPAEPVCQNPEVNVGTGSLDRARWGPVVDRFIGELGQRRVAGHLLDVRENVRFRGGHLSRWANDRYDGTGCALAIELKKVFMDEWTGELDEAHAEGIIGALAAIIPVTLAELARSVG
jgi:N-formylglutamate amidohydrolase